MGVVTSSHFTGRKRGKGHTVNNGAGKQSPASGLWTGPPHIPDFRRFQMGILTLTNEKDCLDHGWKEVPKSHYKRWLEGIFQGRDEGKRIQAGRSLSFSHTYTQCGLMWWRGDPFADSSDIVFTFMHIHIDIGKVITVNKNETATKIQPQGPRPVLGPSVQTKNIQLLSLLSAHSHHFHPLFTEHTKARWHLPFYTDFPVSAL